MPRSVRLPYPIMVPIYVAYNDVTENVLNEDDESFGVQD